jgi:flagellar biosynthesis protein FlhG
MRMLLSFPGAVWDEKQYKKTVKSMRRTLTVPVWEINLPYRATRVDGKRFFLYYDDKKSINIKKDITNTPRTDQADFDPTPLQFAVIRAEDRGEEQVARIIPVGGGKGGIGKSFVTANLGVLLAGAGHRVVMVDLDLGGPNLHTFFGFEQVPVGVGDFLGRRVEGLERAATATRFPNLELIASCDCSFEIANLPYAQKLKIIDAVSRLPHDIVLLDLGAGTGFNTLDFFLAASEGIFLCRPEPTSIENAFRFVKAVYLRRLKQLIKTHAFTAIAREAAEQVREGHSAPADLIDVVLQHDPEKQPFLQQALSRLDFNLVLNQVHQRVDTTLATLGYRMARICNRHLYSNFSFLGNVSFDPQAREAILAKRVYIEQFPKTFTAMDLKNLAGKLSTDGRQPAVGGAYEAAARAIALRGARHPAQRVSL